MDETSGTTKTLFYAAILAVACAVDFIVQRVKDKRRNRKENH